MRFALRAKGSGHGGTVLADTPLQCHIKVWLNICRVADWSSGSNFKIWGPKSVFQLQGDRTTQPPWESLLQGVGEEAPTVC